MIAHTTWRDLFYKLAEAHPDCLMLNFTVKVGQVLEPRKEEKRVRSALFLVGFSSFLFRQPHTEQREQRIGIRVRSPSTDSGLDSGVSIVCICQGPQADTKA